MKIIFCFLLLSASTHSFSQSTTGMVKFDNPIRISSFKVIPLEDGQNKNIQIVFRNVSKLKVKSIKFKWNGQNSSGEPADMNDSEGDITDDYKPGKTGTATFKTRSANLSKITSITVYEVAFDNGTIWTAPIDK